MKFYESSISGVCIVESAVFQDSRGAFSRLFCAKELQGVIGSRMIVQINRSMTHNVGAVRGMHYQNPPHAEMKVVRCIKGGVFDVAVDLRQESASYLKWTAVELTADNGLAFVIPEGCAHGFQVLVEDSELLYLHTEFYAPDAEGGVRYDDPRIGVDWPLAPTDLSARDLKFALISDDFKGIVL